MTRRLISLVLLSSVGLACGAQEEAKSPGADPWSDFKGTYSASAEEGAPSRSEEKAAENHTAEPRAKEAKSAPVKAAAHEIEAADELSTAAPVRPPSRRTIRGESVSTVGADLLTDVAKATLKKRFVSSSTMTGPEYEVVRVQLKGGSMHIVRPAETPSPKGPAIASPKSRMPELGKSDASFYDAEADVLVVVSAGNKAASEKALKAVLKR